MCLDSLWFLGALCLPASLYLPGRVSLCVEPAHTCQRCCQAPRFLCLTLTKEGSVLGARSATGCRTVTVAPHQNIFETGNPPRKKTVCAPFPGESPHLRDPSL